MALTTVSALEHAIILLTQEVHELHGQMASDAHERRNAREDGEILEGLLRRSARIARRLGRLDSATNKPTTPK